MKIQCVHHIGLLMLLLVLQCGQLSGDASDDPTQICGWSKVEKTRYVNLLKNRFGKKHFINWQIGIIQVGDMTTKKNHRVTMERATKTEMRNFTGIDQFYVCTTTNFTSFRENIAAIKDSICRNLKGSRASVTVGGLKDVSQPSLTVTKKVTTNLIIQNSGINDGRSKKPIEYFLHTTSSLGIPSLTWFAESIGYIEMEEEPMMLHLEPGAYHLAEAIVDFLQSYKWGYVSVVLSHEVPGYETLDKELKRVQTERLKSDHPKHFKLEIVTTVPLISSKDEFKECGLATMKWQRKFRRRPYRKYRGPPRCTHEGILQRLLQLESKVIIFHGTFKDLFSLTCFFKDYQDTLFGKEYVWIITPAAIKIEGTEIRQVGHDANLARGVELPGMFGFYYDPRTELEKAAKYAVKIWTRAMETTLEGIKAKGLDAEGIKDEILPSFSCYTSTQTMFWNTGRELFAKMKDVTFEGDQKETIGFLDNGFINTTRFLIMNTRNAKKRTKWYKVGSWSMSNTHPLGSKLQIDGITFSGGANQPPSGRPRKIQLRVATLAERPFVKYSVPTGNKGQKCDHNTIQCWVHPDSLNSSGPPVQTDLGAVVNQTNTTLACCSGLTIDLLLEIKKDLNFDVKLFEVPDRKWGIKTKDGWNGLVKVLIEKEADMVVTAFKITPNRSAYVDFSIPFQETGITIAVALREGKISHTAFLEPYDFSSWCVILIFSVHACGAALFVYEWLSPQGLDRGNVAPRDQTDGSGDKDHRFSLFRSLWLIWSMLFSASVNADNPRGVASRVLASIWALFALVFLASYTANLAAFMIAKEEFFELKGIKDNRLLHPWRQKPPFRFATVPSGATEENIRINFPNMASYMQSYNKSSVQEGIKALKNSDIDAFIYDAYVLDYFEGHDENCKLKTVRNWFAMTGYGIAFPKGSKWLKLVNEKILKYQKDGKMQRWKKYWVSGACKKSNQLGNTNKTLGVKNFISAFILLVGGMILCTLLLILEHAFYRYMRPRIKSWDKYGCCGLVSISMGQLLSFEQSVNQTVDLIKHHKCKNPICETQLWKARHELDVARRKIRKMELALNRSVMEHQEVARAAALTYGEPSSSIPALPEPPDAITPAGACGGPPPVPQRSPLPAARSEPALHEEPEPPCLCHLKNPPYNPAAIDEGANELSRLLPAPSSRPPVGTIAAPSDWSEPPAPSSMFPPQPPLPPHPGRYAQPPPPPLSHSQVIRRQKSSGNIDINCRYNPPQYEMIEKESVL